jgi:hypothetical protein
MTETLLKTINQNSQSETSETSEILSWEEIVKKYPDQTVLIVDFEADEALKIQKGRVVAHVTDHEDIYDQLHLRQGKSFAIQYTGEIPKIAYVPLL